MIQVYISLIKQGIKTIDDVPDKIREEVHNLLEVQK